MDAHPTKCAIVVHYRMETIAVNGRGDTVVSDKKELQKLYVDIDLISLQLSPSIPVDHDFADIAATAQRLIESSQRLIPSSKVDQLKQLLFYIRKRGAASSANTFEDDVASNGSRPASRGPLAPLQEDSANIEKLEEYLELLYESVSDKVRGTRMVLKLVRNPVHVRIVVENESVMSALARVLTEDGKRSMELATNLFSIFVCISAFSEFFPSITRLKVGDVTMKTIERELERFQLWSEELREAKAKATADPSRLEDRANKTRSIFRRQDQIYLLTFSLLLNLSTDLNLERKMVKRGIIALMSDVLETQLSRSKVLQLSSSDLPSLPPRAEVVQVLTNFLLKLSLFRENVGRFLEIAEQLNEQLMGLLQKMHGSPQVMIACLSLLNNLAHDLDFRQAIINQNGLIPFLTNFLQDSQGAVHEKTLRLLYMLSQDDGAKSIFTFTEIIPIAMRMILESPAERIPLDLGSFVCNLACNARNAAIICGETPDGDQSEPIGLKLLIKRALKTRDPILWKLLRTISNTEGNDTIRMAFLPYIDELGKMLLQTKDYVNVEGAAGNRSTRPVSSRMKTRPPSSMSLASPTPPTPSMANDTSSYNAVVYIEIFGIFAGLDIPDFDYVKLAENYGFVDLVCSQLNKSLASRRTRMTILGESSPTMELEPPNSVAEDDDILLECARLLGTFSQDVEFVDFLLQRGASQDNTASAASSSSILLMVVELLSAKQDDDEMILQTLFAIHQFLLHANSRQFLLQETPQLVTYLMDLMYDNNRQVRTMCDSCLDLIVDSEMECERGQHAEEIKAERFRKYNAEWLQLVGAIEATGGVSTMQEHIAYDEDFDFRQAADGEKIRYDLDFDKMDDFQEAWVTAA